jgi:flagellar hook-basal body complex protein FliE
MNDIRVSQATSAYRDALKAAEKIVSQTSAAESTNPAQNLGPTFSELVGESLQTARNTAYKGESMSMKGLAGKADLTDVVTAVSNAELALNTVVSIRDRVINAYQDIIKMPI